MALNFPTTKTKKTGGLIFPDVKVEKKEVIKQKLPPKKVLSEAEKYNLQQDTLLKKVGRVLLPKKLESKFGVEKIEKVKTPLVGGYERLTPEQKTRAKQITKKELPTELKPKLPSLYKGLVEEASIKDVPFIGSGKEAVDLFKIADAYKRVSKNKGSEKDKQVLNDYYDEEERKQEERKNIGYRAGETVRGSLRFMGELVPVGLSEFFTAGVAPTGETYAGSQVAKLGALKTLKKALTDKVVRNTVKKSATKNLKTLSKQMVVTGATNIPRGTAERLIGVVDTDTGEILQKGQEVKDAIINSVTGHAVELATEMGGGVSGKALSSLTKPARNYVTKSAIYKALKKKLKGSSDKQVENLLSRVGWNGVIGEFFEERDADILNEALYQVGLGDQPFDGLTKEDVATELIAFSLMGGGIKVGTKIAEGLQARKLPPKKETTKLILPKSIEEIEPTKLVIPKKKELPLKKVVEKPVVVEKKVSKEISPLTKEAKKYKSAEEFVEDAKGIVNRGNTEIKFISKDGTKIELNKTVRNIGDGRIMQEIEGTVNGDFVGIRFHSDGETVRIIGFSSEAKGKGYGTDILNKLIKDSKDSGITKIIADNTHATKSANYWKKQGFKLLPDEANAVLNIKPTPKSQLTDIFNKAQEVKPVKVVKPKLAKQLKKKAPVIKPKEISVPREQLPVKAKGKEKVSRLEARTKYVLGKLSKEQIDEFGLATYNEINKKENIKKASEYVSKNPNEALEVLKGNVKTPKGILRNSILVALQQVSNENVELATKLSSLFSTRLGQELSILTELDKFSPASIMSDIIKIKEKKIAKQFKKSKEQTKKEMKDKIEKDTQKRVKKARKNKKTFYDLVDELKC